jgi:fumarylacetoacetase
LRDARNAREGGFDITLDVLLRTRRMREADLPPVRVSRGSFSSMYWTVAQLVAHHASNGCNLRPGDLLASGTVSGPTKESRGCLLERTWKGTEPLELPSGETRRFLEDGDEVIMRGWCEREGARRIGFGEAAGTVTSLPAPPPPGTSSAPS